MEKQSKNATPTKPSRGETKPEMVTAVATIIIMAIILPLMFIGWGILRTLGKLP